MVSLLLHEETTVFTYFRSASWLPVRLAQPALRLERPSSTVLPAAPALLASAQAAPFAPLAGLRAATFHPLRCGRDGTDGTEATHAQVQQIWNLSKE